MTRRAQDQAKQDMTLAECASYLHLSEKTVLKLAQDSKLPGQVSAGKWKFNRQQIDDWLAEQYDDEPRDLESVPDGMQLPLEELMPADAIIADLEATTALGVVEELAARAYSNQWLHDKPWFVGAVVEREALASTAIDGGAACLHTRAREGHLIARPFIIFGRSYNGIDFGAPDGKPTFLFFLLGLKYDKLHLPILGRLARILRSPATTAKLRSLPSTTKIRALLLKKDAEARTANNDKEPVETLEPKMDRKQRLRAIMRVDAQRKHRARQAEEAAKKAGKKAARSTTSRSSSARASTRSRANSTEPAAGSAAADASTDSTAAADGAKTATGKATSSRKTAAKGRSKATSQASSASDD